MNKQHNILPSSPIDVFFGLATEGGDVLQTQDSNNLGFEGIAYIDSKQYNPLLSETINNITQSFVNYTPAQIEKIIQPTQYSYLLVNNNDFLRTQDGNFIIL